MRPRPRTAVEIVSILAIALGWALNFAGVGGIGWQVLAFGGSCVFFVLVVWHIAALNGELHRPEQQIQLTIRPDPMTVNQVTNWFQVARLPPNRQHVWAMLFVDVRNTDTNPRTISEIYLELCTPRPDRWPFEWWPTQKQIVTVPPMRVDAHIDWHKRPNPSLVDWSFGPASQTQTHRLFFDRSWATGEDGLSGVPDKTDLYLVTEVGGKVHARRWDLSKAK